MCYIIYTLIYIYILVFIYILVITYGTQGFFLALNSGSFLAMLSGPYAMPEIKPKSAAGKAKTLTALLLFQPQTLMILKK